MVYIPFVRAVELFGVSFDIVAVNEPCLPQALATPVTARRKSPPNRAAFFHADSLSCLPCQFRSPPVQQITPISFTRNEACQ